MASPKGKNSRKEGSRKKTYNGQSKFTKYGNPGPKGGNKKYKKHMTKIYSEKPNTNKVHLLFYFATCWL